MTTQGGFGITNSPPSESRGGLSIPRARRSLFHYFRSRWNRRSDSRRDIPYRSAVFFFFTLLTTLYWGIYHQMEFEGLLPQTDWSTGLGFDGFRFVNRTLFAQPLYGLGLGLPFAFSLMTILAAHEMGHYLMCRRYRISASLPLFIPSPLIIGTFGAFIRIRSPFTNRRALFDVALAGPLAGVAISIPILVAGLRFSRLETFTADQHGLYLGTSLLFDLLGRWVVPGITEPGMVLTLHPMAFAGWVGLMVTALNLLPAGQLDGGHIAYAVFGRRHRVVSLFTIVCLLGMGVLTLDFFWILWGGLILLLGFRHPPTLQEYESLGRARRWLASLALLLFLGTFTIIRIQVF